MPESADHSKPRGYYTGCVLTLNFPNGTGESDLAKVTNAIHRKLPGITLKLQQGNQWERASAEIPESHSLAGLKSQRRAGAPMEEDGGRVIMNLALEVLKELKLR